MTRIDLSRKLEKAGVSAEAYSLQGGLPNERYILDSEPGGRWVVYYSEHGEWTRLRFFDGESAACEFFLDQILEDRAARRSAQSLKLTVQALRLRKREQNAEEKQGISAHGR